MKLLVSVGLWPGRQEVMQAASFRCGERRGGQGAPAVGLAKRLNLEAQDLLGQGVLSSGPEGGCVVVGWE